MDRGPSPPATPTAGSGSPPTGPSWPPASVELPVPSGLERAVLRRPLVEAAPGWILLRVPRVARFLVEPGTPVRVDRARGATDADVGCFLRGPVAAAALLLAGLFPLRAAAVAIAGRGVLICGAPGAGTSTMTAALALRGHPVLADRIGLVTGSPPTVEPVDGEVQLWPDVVRLLGLDPGRGRLIRPVLAKRAFRLGPPPEAAPLRAIVFLHRDEQDTVRVEASPSLTGRFRALLPRRWHSALVGPLGLRDEQFRSLTRLARVDCVVRVRGAHQTVAPADLAASVEHRLTEPGIAEGSP